MTDGKAVISEAEAAEVWRRAAQLQAEAERRMGALPTGGEAPAAGFPVAQVEAVAVEAGISPEFVRQALAEIHAGDEPEAGRVARAVTGNAPRSVHVTRHFGAAPAEVLAAVQRVLPAEPYRLALTEASGDPRAGGTLSFRIPDGTMGTRDRLTATRYAAAETIRIAIRPLAEGCEVDATAVLRPGGSENLAMAGVLSGFGAAGGWLVTAFASAALAGLAGPVILAAGIPGLLLGGGGALAGYRAFYRSSIRGSRGELEGLLAAVDAHIRTGGAFGAGAVPGLPSGSPESAGTVTPVIHR